MICIWQASPNSTSPRESLSHLHTALNDPDLEEEEGEASLMNRTKVCMYVCAMV